MQADGDPLDACSLAAYVALQCTKVPKLELSVGESGSAEDFEVSGDLADALRLHVDKVPITITVYKVIAFYCSYFFVFHAATIISSILSCIHLSPCALARL